MVEKIKTGIYSKDKKISLDSSLSGGIPKGNIVLVTGSSGTGKSTLCYQIIAQQAKNGLKCQYLAFDQTKQDILDNAKGTGINLKNKNIKINTFDELHDITVDKIIKNVKNNKTQFVVLDSLASITGAIPENEFSKIQQGKIQETYMPLMISENRVVRRIVRRIILELKKLGITALLINELPEGTKKLSKDDESDFLADGVILINYLEIGVTDYRSLIIRKMRKVAHEKDLIPFNITSKGIVLAKKV
jgi:circadian clock protein KaiC